MRPTSLQRLPVHLALITIGTASAQPCLIDYTITADPPPVAGQYGAGQQVLFCLTINNWNQAGINWLHGVVPSFGPGWDAASFIAGAPPFECGFSGGSWTFANSVTGTSPFNVGPQGPGWFFDLDNDGDPGNNLGDDCAGPWIFCFLVTVPSGAGCINGSDLTITFNTFGDSETGSWDTPGCGPDIVPTFNVTAVCCDSDAGIDGFAEACFSDPPLDLTAFLGGTPDPGGSWTDLFGLPVAMPLDLSTAFTGEYYYTVTSPGCAPDQSTVFLTVNLGGNAGADVVVPVCSDSPPVDLYAYMFPADAGGTWTDPDGFAFSGFFDPAINPAGDYTYTVAAVGNCPGDASVATVQVTLAPNAGTSTILNVCTNSAPVDLLTAVGGDPGGSWSGPDGLPSTGVFDPLTSLPGTYGYTLFGQGPCLFASSTVDVILSSPPQNGTVIVTAVCSIDPPLDLFPLFNGLADPGGSWVDPNGDPFGGTLNPAVAIPGTYIYTVAGTPPCADGSNSVEVSVTPAPDPGLPGGLTICAQGDPVDLFTALLGTPDAGGTWTDPNGAATPGTVNPVTALPGTYTYNLPANAQCPAASSTVELATVQPSDAGTDNTVSACENEPNIFLDALLGGAQDVNGSWTSPGGGASNGIVDPTLLDSGAYVYTVQGIAPCPDDQATILVTIDTLPVPGDDAELSICANLEGVDLFPLLGAADTVGTWTAPDGSPFSGVFDPASDASGDYTYTVVGTGACAGLTYSAMVTATALHVPEPLFTQDTTQGCTPLDIAFELADPTITLSEWTFGDGATGDGILEASHTYEDLGYHEVSVIVLDDNGCTDTLAVDSAVLVHDLPNAFFITQPNPAGTTTPDVNFTTQITDYPSYAWTAGGDSIGSGIPFGLHFPYFEARTTEICLVVTDTNGCVNEHCEDVVIDQDLAVYVPNAFTPNGNGINEVFYPVILGAETTDYDFGIWDRWGELVFFTTDRFEVWNGGMNNSETPLEPGVFTWRVRLRESAKAEREDIYGHVTLVK
jgi:gliding motility-associated-like protein